MISVKGKWALITGASRGIGYLAAISMAKQGCNLVLHSRSLGHTKKIMEAVKAHGVEAYCIQAELANHEEVVGMLDEIEARGTAIDIVFNNAAVQIAYREDYWKTPVEDFDLSFRINFIASQNRSSSTFDSLSVGSTINVPGTGKETVGAW